MKKKRSFLKILFFAILSLTIVLSLTGCGGGGGGSSDGGDGGGTNTTVKDQIRVAVLSANSLMYQVINNIGYTFDNAIYNFECDLSASVTLPLLIKGNIHNLYASGQVKLFNNGSQLDCNDLLNSTLIYIKRAEVTGSGNIKGSELNSNFQGTFFITGSDNFLVNEDFEGFNISDYFIVNGSGTITNTVYAGQKFPNISGTASNVTADVAKTLDLIDRISSGVTLRLGDISRVITKGDINAQTSDCKDIHIHFNGTNLIDVVSTCTSPTQFKVDADTGDIIESGSRACVLNQVL